MLVAFIGDLVAKRHSKVLMASFDCVRQMLDDLLQGRVFACEKECLTLIETWVITTSLTLNKWYYDETSF